ncbi:hypothetical protein [Nocardia sp. NPDC050406]|uniref:hypothetical protein n=1 Tax=Nocardia sp. NPDC050406 TaxID=3364318 RepID=UPI0037AE66A2
MIATTYAVVVTAVADPRSVDGMEWERAVEYLPSIASRHMRAWLRHQEDATGRHRGVVIPGSRRSPALRLLPQREVCVPSAEYLLFADAVRADIRSRRAGTAAPGTTGADSREPGSEARAARDEGRMSLSEDRLPAPHAYPLIDPYRLAAVMAARR